MIRKFILISFLCALPCAAMAQETPTFTIVDLGAMNLMNTEKKSSDADALDAIGNSDMKSVLQLQNQISMINALTNWQSQIKKMQEAYEKTGMSFTPPSPPRNICEQVPANTVCGDAYPDLAPVADIAPVQLASVAATPVKATKSAKKSSAATAPAEPVASYEWGDIQCKASDCKAVIVDLTSGARITALPGEMVDDNVMVKEISSNGVILSVKGKTEILKPSRPKPQSKSADAAPPENLSEALKNVPSNPEPVEPIVLDDGKTSTPPTENNSAEPGPTGLF